MKIVVYHKIVIAICVVVISSCKSDKDVDRLAFPVQKELKSEFIGPADHFMMATKITRVDSLLFIVDQKGEFLLHVYNINNDQVIKSYARQGQGPGEFMAVELSHSLKDSDDLILNDPIQKRISKIRLDSLLANDHYVASTKFFPNPNLNAVYGAEFINDTLIVGTSTSGKGRFFLWNPVSDQFKYVSNFPALDRRFTEPQNAYVYYNWIDVTPDKSKIASALLHVNEIDVFDTSGKWLRSIRTTKSAPNLYAEDGKIINDNTVFYYKDLYASDKYLYVLFSGGKTSDKLHGGRYGSEIHVYDWEGYPVTHYQLDKSINSFTVDEARGIIYGIRDLEKQPIVRFKIS